MDYNNLSKESELDNKKKILFVCTVNKMRSATAYEVYQSDPRFEVHSAGTHPSAKQVITAELLGWADSIVVMERVHRNQIRKHYPEIYSEKKIACLYIPDEYDFMDPELIELIKSKFESLNARRLI